MMDTSITLCENPDRTLLNDMLELPPVEGES
jgi:hypothetical protein